MLNLPSNKLCKLKSKWQHEGDHDTWILIYPIFAELDERAPLYPLLTIRHKFCLIHSDFDLSFKIDDTIFIIDNGDWILDKPTAENMFMLGKALKESNRYTYNLKTNKLIKAHH